jgi:hypothetical protein
MNKSDELDLAFQKDGVIVVKNFFETTERSNFLDAYNKLKKLVKENPSSREKRFYCGPLPTMLDQVYKSEQLVNLIERLLGESNLCLYMKRMLIKDSLFNGDVSIHQDMPYFSGGQNKISVFIPLNRMNLNNGGLIFLKGTHKYGMLQRGTICVNNFPSFQELICDVEVGDLVIADFLTWHYSVPAVNNDDRPLLQLVYQPSHDGSWGSSQLGVDSPTLVRGQWKTEYFAPWGSSTMPDL